MEFVPTVKFSGFDIISYIVVLVALNKSSQDINSLNGLWNKFKKSESGARTNKMERNYSR